MRSLPLGLSSLAARPAFQAFLEHAETVHERLIEEQTLRNYFGPDVPLHFGYFPRHVLQKMASDMALAETEFTRRSRQAEQEQREALGRWQHRGMKWRLSSAPHQEVFIPWDTPHPSSFNPQSGLDGTGLPIPPGIPQATGVQTHPMYSAIPFQCATHGDLEHLPARLLRLVHPQRFALRRQEAAAISRALPPGPTIQQPRRPSLTPPDEVPYIQQDTNLKEN